jgi:hypothetical protein
MDPNAYPEQPPVILPLPTNGLPQNMTGEEYDAYLYNTAVRLNTVLDQVEELISQITPERIAQVQTIQRNPIISNLLKGIIK